MVSEVRDAEGPNVPAGAVASGLVAVGASAGGLAAFERFFRAVPPATGLAYVVLQHLSPAHESILPQLLASYCALPVENVTDGTRPAPDRVYVIPPNATLLLLGGLLRLQPLEPRATRHPIDAFLTSLARELGPRAAAVILSGTGSDGAAGIHAVRTAGGLAAAQTPGEAEYDAMPRSAVATGDVEYLLPAADLPPLLARELLARAAAPGWTPAAEGGPTDPLEEVVRAVAAHGGRELGDYKRATMGRRVRRRMAALGVARMADYAALVSRDGAEARLLLDELMISVTQFLRDPESFQALARTALPELVRAAAGRAVRAWVPGCATGEEAYTLAILLREEARRTGQPDPELQIFATDVDAQALTVARRGVYPPAIRAVVPPELLGRWFQEVEGGFEVVKSIREACLFSLHDVLQDPPFSRLDLVSCRNLLIYFEVEAQQRLLPVFHYALRPGGILFLGGAEQVDERAPGLEAVDRAHRDQALDQLRVRVFRRGRPRRQPARRADPRFHHRRGASPL
jgi:two-component system CheB/CheR fusion protein